jgi:hypothetical protein
VRYPIQPENLRKSPGVGNVVVYKLLPKDFPTDPDRLWRGRVAKAFSGTDCIEVTVLEQGYEGLTEIIQLSQIVMIPEE